MTWVDRVPKLDSELKRLAPFADLKLRKTKDRFSSIKPSGNQAGRTAKRLRYAGRNISLSLDERAETFAESPRRIHFWGETKQRRRLSD